jgi:hypothetical protein
MAGATEDDSRVVELINTLDHESVSRCLAVSVSRNEVLLAINCSQRDVAQV